MLFTKESLQEIGYSWLPDGCNILPDRLPTRKSFDRFSGNAMLRMINLFSVLIHRLTLAEAQNMEYTLAQELPLKACSELSVFNWLKEKYLYGQNIN